MFFTDYNPVTAAEHLPDRHIVKMPVEAVQMLVSAAKRHDFDPKVITKADTVHKGGYHNHPCTQWVGDSADNFKWTIIRGLSLCTEYTKRYGKTHFVEGQLHHIQSKPIDYFYPLLV